MPVSAVLEHTPVLHVHDKCPQRHAFVPGPDRSCCFIKQRFSNVLRDMQWLVPCEDKAEQRGMRKRAGGATAAAWLNQGTSEVEVESGIVMT